MAKSSSKKSSDNQSSREKKAAKTEASNHKYPSEDCTGRTRLLSTISNPVVNTDCNVLTSTPHKLCLANGNLTAPASGSLRGIYIKIVQGTVLPGDNDIYNSPDGYQFVPQPGNWNLRMQIPAAVGANTFCAVTATQVFVPSLFGYKTVLIDRTDISFNGVAANCPQPMPVAGEDTPSLLTPRSETSLQRRTRGWIHQRIDVAAGGPVKVMDGSQPLSASVIECYVRNIAWKHSIIGPDGTVYRTEHVTRALGDHIAAPPFPSTGVPDFRFEHAPRNAVVIWQNDALRPFVHVVAAESKKQRELVYTQPGQDIWVAPNFDGRSNVYEGGFDLYVKVIEP